MKNNFIDGQKLFNLIEGHSVYQGDNILSAIMCMMEGKDVKKIIPMKGE